MPQNAAPDFIGQTSTITSGAAVRITTNSAPLNNGITVRAMKANGANILVGFSNVSGSNGYELQPGEAHLFAIPDASVLYAISAGATGAVCWEMS